MLMYVVFVTQDSYQSSLLGLLPFVHMTFMLRFNPTIGLDAHLQSQIIIRNNVSSICIGVSVLNTLSVYSKQYPKYSCIQPYPNMILGTQ